MSSDPQRQARERVAHAFNRAIPHNHALGAAIVEVGDAMAVVRLDYTPALLGDAERGIWHTGPAISLADAACGMAVLLALPDADTETIATLDLRMDYLRPAAAEAPLIARAHCHHLTRHIAFVRASLDQGEAERATATCTASFMRGANPGLAPA